MNHMTFQSSQEARPFMTPAQEEPIYFKEINSMLAVSVIMLEKSIEEKEWKQNKRNKTWVCIIWHIAESPQSPNRTLLLRLNEMPA